MTALENLLKSLQNVKVIDKSVPYSKYIPLDLSISNSGLSKLNMGNSDDFENYIANYLKENNAAVGYGGYNEIRNLYKRSTAFNDKSKDERNIHIGLDLWIQDGTSVLAALDGKIHSFKYNDSLGDYGPTIIMEHEIENQIFYTLYGHLSLESLTNLSVGMAFKKGEEIATLGTATVNGDYAPHLHFQIIDDIGQYVGDYPGVCSENDLEYYLTNCPDPNLLLKI